jgi:hypothetical protein
MQYLLTIQFFTLALTFVDPAFNKSYLHYEYPSSEKNDFIIAYSFGSADTLSAAATIDSLKIGQRYFIDVESNGCFHHSDLRMIIAKETDGYIASFKMTGKIDQKKINRKFKKIKLTDLQIDSIRSFEKQLLAISALKYNCTTVDTYTLTVGTIKTVCIVDKCDWQGIGNLVAFLFKKAA